MEMERMLDVLSPNYPFLDCAQFRFCQDRVGPERLAVHGPQCHPMSLGTTAGENEFSLHAHVVLRQNFDIGEPGWHGARISLFASDDKPHNLAGATGSTIVDHGDLISDIVTREVDDYIESLSLGNVDHIMFHRGCEQTHIAADLNEAGSVVETELVAAGIGGIEDAEAVLGIRYFQHRPWRTVDEDAVPEHPAHVLGAHARSFGQGRVD